MKKILASLMGLLVAGLFSACNSGGGGCCGTCTGQEFDEQTEIALGTCDKNHEGNSEAFYRCRMCCSDPTSLYGCYYTWVNSRNEKIKDSDLYCDGRSQEPFSFHINPILFPLYSSSSVQSSSSSSIPERPTINYGSMTDSRDGKMYKTVVIGTQTWMAENLNYDVDESRCYDNDESNCSKYGRLYTWYDANAACPANWHLPSNDEWNALFTTVGGDSTASIMLKSQSDWYSLGNGLDFFGFSALPAGYCTKGYCSSIGMSTSFWSSTEYDDEVYIVYDTGKKDSRWLFGAHNAFLQYNSDNVFLRVDPNNQNNEYSVRCLKNTLSSSSSVIPQSSSSSISVLMGTMTDSRDGQTYKTVTIGTQTWMAENLNYADSTMTPSLKGGSSCYLHDQDYCAQYGRLYTWAAAMDSVKTGCGNNLTCSPTMPVQGICPTGWHLPSQMEWDSLFTVVGGDSIASWAIWSQNDNGNGNAFGFSALSAGYRRIDGLFHGKDDDSACFWSSSEYNSVLAYHVFLSYDDYLSLDYIRKGMGFSVRCLKD